MKTTLYGIAFKKDGKIIHIESISDSYTEINCIIEGHSTGCEAKDIHLEEFGIETFFFKKEVKVSEEDKVDWV